MQLLCGGSGRRNRKPMMEAFVDVELWCLSGSSAGRPERTSPIKRRVFEFAAEIRVETRFRRIRKLTCRMWMHGRDLMEENLDLVAEVCRGRSRSLQPAGCWQQFRKDHLRFSILVGHKTPQLPALSLVRLRVGTSWHLSI